MTLVASQLITRYARLCKTGHKKLNCAKPAWIADCAPLISVEVCSTSYQKKQCDEKNPEAGIARACACSSPNFTDTTFETPGSCMVTPYITGAADMVRLLCVMMMNCVCIDI